MTSDAIKLYRIIKDDPRYPIEAYLFVRESLAFAADNMELDSYETVDFSESGGSARQEHHLTGQQLCEAIRQYANHQFGYMSKVVLKNWGIDSTSCFGDLVYNMISVGIMKKSEYDQRCHFDDVYQFDDVFQTHFELCDSLAHRRA